MRTRSNFGVIGNTLPAVSTSTTGGIFSLDDQRIAKKAGNWPSPPVSVDVLLIAGGGSGASYISYSPGGGAGGFVETSNVSLISSTTYTITVGAGGTVNNQTDPTAQGSNSTITGSGFSTITAYGGGYGAYYTTGANGGSGGGGGHNSSPGGKGVYPGSSYISATRQGYDGGAGFNGSSASAGAGGGAGGAGADGVPNGPGAAGGIGKQSSITGVATYYAGGGGGGVESYTTYAGGTGGTGGGGRGKGTAGNATDGAVNTGSGGGGGGTGSVGLGGSGIVIIRSLNVAVATTGSPTVTTNSGYTIYKFTSSGTITF